MAKGEGGATEVDTDEGNDEGGKEGGKEHGKAFGEGGEQGHYHKDEPDMVGFPNGADGKKKAVSLLPGAGTGSQGGPDAAAEIGAAE